MKFKTLFLCGFYSAENKLAFVVEKLRARIHQAFAQLVQFLVFFFVRSERKNALVPFLVTLLVHTTNFQWLPYSWLVLHVSGGFLILQPALVVGNVEENVLHRNSTFFFVRFLSVAS